VVALLAVTAAVLVATAVIRLPQQTPRPPAATPSSAPANRLVAADPLTAEGLWQRRDDPTNQTTCTFDGALVVTKRSTGSYRCPGPQEPLTDFTAAVDVTLKTPGSCASVWFRFDSAGYALRVCADGYQLITHGVGTPTALTALHTFAFTGDPIPLNTPVRVGIIAHGTELSFDRAGKPVGTWRDASFLQGRVVLGIFPVDPAAQPPFTVSFANVEIRAR
jgi:hypothetical protein